MNSEHVELFVAYKKDPGSVAQVFLGVFDDDDLACKAAQNWLSSNPKGEAGIFAATLNQIVPTKNKGK